MDVTQCRRLTQPAVDLTGLLLGGPKLQDAAVKTLAEVEAERKADSGRQFACLLGAVAAAPEDVTRLAGS